jgi:hypothetical protein
MPHLSLAGEGLTYEGAYVACARTGGPGSLTGGPTAIRLARRDPSFNRWAFSNPITGLFLDAIGQAGQVLMGNAISPAYVFPDA